MSLRRHWGFDPGVTFLNHGSYGACPTAVLEQQARLRSELESNPVAFLKRALEPRLDAALEALARFVGAQPDDLAFVPNATTGVNAVLRSLDFSPGDEILVTDHTYEACINAAAYVAGRTGARVVVAKVPFPIGASTQVVEAVMEKAGPRVRLALLDHVTSPTALVWPIAELVATLAARGIDTLVDGAHAPGMLPLELSAMRPAYYTGNCHKWMCAPKGAAFLYVRQDRQANIVPVTVSGLSQRARKGEASLRARFAWTGTQDPTAALCVPFVIEYAGSLLPGGWPELMAANRALALRARRMVCDALGQEVPAPEDMIGSMAAVRLPAGARESLGERLFRDEKIEVPVFSWGNNSTVLCRLSAYAYNSDEEYQRLARALLIFSSG